MRPRPWTPRQTGSHEEKLKATFKAELTLPERVAFGADCVEHALSGYDEPRALQALEAGRAWSSCPCEAHREGALVASRAAADAYQDTPRERRHGWDREAIDLCRQVSIAAAAIEAHELALQIPVFAVGLAARAAAPGPRPAAGIQAIFEYQHDLIAGSFLRDQAFEEEERWQAEFLCHVLASPPSSDSSGARGPGQ